MRPDSPALSESRRFGVRPVDPLQPLRWLARGWRDLWRDPLVGLLHGAAVAGFGALLVLLARERFWLLAGAFSGFLLVAPVIATGLYAVSRARECGERAGLRTALAAWRPRDGRLIAFSALLALAGTGWVLTSASLIWGFAGRPVHTPLDFLALVVRDDSLLFPAWLALGAVLAAPVFASSVVAMPMLLDRPVGVWTAVLTSWRAVMAHPLPLALWAALIMALVALGMASALLGLVVVVPWLGHASWHAYRDLVSAPGG